MNITHELNDTINSLMDATNFATKTTVSCTLSPDAIDKLCRARQRVIDVMIPKPRMPIVFVMGPTNVGKTTIMDTLRHYTEVGTVEVGKMMRAKYPPDFFKGQAAPKHTATEAMEMCMDGIKQCERDGKKICFVDGQPRDVMQAEQLSQLPNPHTFWLLWASEANREARARNRDKDPEKLALSLQRMQGDCIGLFEVTTRLALLGREVIVTNVESDGYAPFPTAFRIAGKLGVVL